MTFEEKLNCILTLLKRDRDNSSEFTDQGTGFLIETLCEQCEKIYKEQEDFKITKQEQNELKNRLIVDGYIDCVKFESINTPLINITEKGNYFITNSGYDDKKEKKKQDLAGNGNNTFSEYIIMEAAENKDEFLKKLKENYLINKAPKDYALMILALKQLSLIKIKKGNQTNVYSALKSFLDNTDIGTNEALNKTIRNIEQKLTDKNEHVKSVALKELNPHIETITNITKKLSKTD